MRSTGVETLPLKGLRVVDLSRVFAMPYAAAFLADLGAEVIKVEGCGFLAADTRLGGPFGGPWADDVPGDLHWERNGVFHVLNRGKRSVTLDLNQTDGLDALKKLIATSDVVVENFTPRVMRKFGLDYPNMRELRADIIMLSNTGYGHSGPFSHYGAMAASLEPTHGCGAFIGYEGAKQNRQLLHRLLGLVDRAVLGYGGTFVPQAHWQRALDRSCHVPGGHRFHG
jgi:crotonobetainyl-CoA:carnitine CoA-transferase CaiB-like acyl-CoA transferase